ncbi:MAG: hypothetical protein GY711_24270 [bacterium]|nr:hypothetical protein [bacterium]
MTRLAPLAREAVSSQGTNVIRYPFDVLKTEHGMPQVSRYQAWQYQVAPAAMA